MEEGGVDKRDKQGDDARGGGGEEELEGDVDDDDEADEAEEDEEEKSRIYRDEDDLGSRGMLVYPPITDAGSATDILVQAGLLPIRRSCILLMTLQNGELTVYSYNLHQRECTKLSTQLSQLLSWVRLQ